MSLKHPQTDAPGTTPNKMTEPDDTSTAASADAEQPAGTDAKAEGDSSAAGTRILFVRHGQTPTTGSVLPGRTPGLHLSDEGRAQARTAAERIAALGKSVAAVYASPMERTCDTAEPIADACGLEVITHQGLNECDFGQWTGRELKELRKLDEWATVQRNPSGFSFPDGESFAHMQARALQATAHIAQQHRGKVVVAVSHADVIKAIIAAAMGTPLDLFQRIVVSPCSISAVDYTSGGPVVLTVNSTGDNLGALKLS